MPGTQQVCHEDRRNKLMQHYSLRQNRLSLGSTHGLLTGTCKAGTPKGDQQVARTGHMQGRGTQSVCRLDSRDYSLLPQRNSLFYVFLETQGQLWLICVFRRVQLHGLESSLSCYHDYRKSKSSSTRVNGTIPASVVRGTIGRSGGYGGETRKHGPRIYKTVHYFN